MTQQEKAREVLDRLFLQSRRARVGVSEQFLRWYAAKKWVGKDEPLDADVLIDEAEARVLAGELIIFNRGTEAYYKPPAKQEFVPPDHKKGQPDATLESGPDCPKPPNPSKGAGCAYSTTPPCRIANDRRLLI